MSNSYWTNSITFENFAALRSKGTLHECRYFLKRLISIPLVSRYPCIINDPGLPTIRSKPPSTKFFVDDIFFLRSFTASPAAVNVFRPFM